MDLIARRNALLACVNNKLIYEGKNLVFDGTNFIDTGFAPYSEENIDKDFQITLTIKEYTPTSQGTIVNAMLEVRPYPGFCFRNESSSSPLFIAGTGSYRVTNNAPFYYDKPIIIKREGGVVNAIYEGNIVVPTLAARTTFNNHLLIGCSEHNGNEKWRFIIGTIGYIRIEYI